MVIVFKYIKGCRREKRSLPFSASMVDKAKTVGFICGKERFWQDIRKQFWLS